MCGIVGYLGHRQATEVLVEGLSKLEYRGYDSAGGYRGDRRLLHRASDERRDRRDLRPPQRQGAVPLIALRHSMIRRRPVRSRPAFFIFNCFPAAIPAAYTAFAGSPCLLRTAFPESVFPAPARRVRDSAFRPPPFPRPAGIPHPPPEASPGAYRLRIPRAGARRFPRPSRRASRAPTVRQAAP